MTSLTSAQQLAVDAPGNVLVVAGAGTGKTSTLVRRCIERIIGGSSLDRILMVTFTEAAAAEMRHRIAQALEERIPASRRGMREANGSALGVSVQTLEEQLALVDAAQISTLSSFCLELVREHFHELRLDPQITVLDEERLAPLVADTLDALFHDSYARDAGASEAVRQLVRLYGNGSDFGIRKLVLKIHRYTQTLANPAQWFQEQFACFKASDPARWREWLVEGIAEWRTLWTPALQTLAHEAPAIATCARELQALLERPDLAAFFNALECIQATDQDAKAWNKRKTAARPQIARFFDDVEFLLSLRPAGTSDPLGDDWDRVRAHMLALLDLARDFGARFTSAKRELGGVDFADIEQLALTLLHDANGATATAHAVRARFDHVFVDEYQDINAVQDAIICAVSRDFGGTGCSRPAAAGATRAGNRFLVGDVKQSIYRFRLAQPGIFIGYDARWSDSDAGSRLALSENFRSREAILNFVNPLFAALMRRGIGGLDYAEDARLVFGGREERAHFAAARDEDLRRVELHLIAKAAGTDADSNGGQVGEDNELLDLEAVEREARLIARRLRDLSASGLRLHEKGGVERPVEYRDMVVLMRSPGGRVEAFARQFHKLGVPLRAARAGFYDASEISDLLCLLHLLDNPLQDLPLLAVLRSPLAGLSMEEFVEVRCAGKEANWWGTLLRFRAKNSQRRFDEEGSPAAIAWQKVETFLTQFERWRELMLHCSLTQCLETVLSDTHYEALLSADVRGPERLANVRRFIDLARDYDPYRRQGLYRFLRFIEAQREAGVDREPAPAAADNAVQLMSIHRSKGLEFPVVVLANVGGTFNEQHLHEAILLSERFGLCPRVCPDQRSVTYPSLPHWLAKRAERREMLGEEMRLLYVALTRAREMLIITGTAPGRDAASKWSATPPRPISDADILKARSYLDWLRLWLPQTTREEDWRSESEGAGALLRWKLYAADDAYLQVTAAGVTPETKPNAAPFDAALVRRRIEWSYPFAPATEHAAKSSVSALRRAGQDEEAAPMFPLRKFWKLSRSAGTDARDVGSAHHRFQQFVSLDCVDSIETLRAEAARLSEARLLEAGDPDLLRFDRLHAFWQSEVGQMIRRHARNVRRELEFTARFTPRELAALGLGVSEIEDDFVVIQGVADLAVILPNEIWLLDFKTDAIAGSEVSARARFHSTQLAVYARALERVHAGRPVTRRWLCFLAAGRTISV